MHSWRVKTAKIVTVINFQHAKSQRDLRLHRTRNLAVYDLCHCKHSRGQSDCSLPIADQLVADFCLLH